MFVARQIRVCRERSVLTGKISFNRQTEAKELVTVCMVWSLKTERDEEAMPFLDLPPRQSYNKNCSDVGFCYCNFTRTIHVWSYKAFSGKDPEKYPVLNLLH